jgi:hypothetical protein
MRILNLEKYLINISFVSLSLLLSTVIKSQCIDENFAFKEGEIINYDIKYNWGFIWVDAGRVEFSVSSKMYKGEFVYHLTGIGNSLPKHDWIYKVRDKYQSYMDKETLLPLWYERDTYEGGYEVHNQFYFNHEQEKVYTKTQNSDKPFEQDTIDLPPCTYDVMSLIYFSRNIDFSNKEVNELIPITAIIDNEIFDLYIRYRGREVLETKEGKTYNTVKFSALLVEGTIFKGGEDLFVWVTDDRNRIPVLVEAKILVGSVKALLTSAKGIIPYPESQIK